MRKYLFLLCLSDEIYLPIHLILCTILCFSLLVLLPSLQAHCAQVTLQWDAETDQSLAGYKVYYGASSRNYDSYVNVGNTTTCTISNLQDGHTYYFSATAVDKTGGESGYSNEAIFNSPATCTSALSSSTQSFSSSGGTASVMITAGTTCTWTAISNTSWIIITSNSSGSRSSIVNYSVAENSSPASRSGTMTIAGKSFTVTQSGVACTYSISPATQSFSPIGGTGSVGVTTPSGCAWTAASNQSWITISSGTKGTGNGTVNFSVGPNDGSSRTGTLTVAGQTFAVNQGGGGSGSGSGSGTCTYSIAWGFQSFYDADGGWGVIYVTSPPGCSWRAVSDSSWIVINSGGNGSGNEEVVFFSVAPNTSNIWRNGMISVGENNFPIGQLGAW
jgi:hypothetical protein